MDCVRCAERAAENGRDLCFKCRMSSIRWGTYRLQKANQGHYTMRMIRDDIYAGARETGKDIQRYTGRQKDRE